MSDNNNNYYYVNKKSRQMRDIQMNIKVKIKTNTRIYEYKLQLGYITEAQLIAVAKVRIKSLMDNEHS